MDGRGETATANRSARILQPAHRGRRGLRTGRPGVSVPTRAVVAGVVVSVVIGVGLVLGAGTARSTGRPLAPQALRADSVPLEYLPWLTKASRRCSAVTAPLLAAQIDVGSGWDRRYRGPSGSLGPAQFMPATWAQWGADGDRDGDVQPRSIPDAVAAQSAYLCWLVRAVGGEVTAEGRLEAVLAAYHAGPGAVRRYGGVPPFASTRAYVDAVRAAIARYTPRTDAAGVSIVPVRLGTVAGVAADRGWPEPVPGAVTVVTVNRPPGAAFPSGVLLGGAPGDDTVNVASGVVDSVTSVRGGDVVRIDHLDGTATVYGPLDGITVKGGSPVAAGAVLGKVPRSTGRTGFAVVERGRTVDPQRYYRSRWGVDVLGRVLL